MVPIKYGLWDIDEELYNLLRPLADSLSFEDIYTPGKRTAKPKSEEGSAILEYMAKNDVFHEGETKIPALLKRWRMARQSRIIHIERGDDGLGTDYSGMWDKYWKVSNDLLLSLLFAERRPKR